MITPNDIKNLDLLRVNLDQLEEEIDDSIKSYHGWYPYEYASITEELPRAVREALAERYKLAGWKFVYHTSTSEIGERPGLSAFKFSMYELNYTDTEGYRLV